MYHSSKPNRNRKKANRIPAYTGSGDTAQLTEGGGDVLIQQIRCGIYCVPGSKIQKCSLTVQSLCTHGDVTVVYTKCRYDGEGEKSQHEVVRRLHREGDIRAEPWRIKEDFSGTRKWVEAPFRQMESMSKAYEQ